MWVINVKDLPGVANVLSTLLWIVFCAIVVRAFRVELRALIQTMIGRLRGGASVKIWNLELGAVNALPSVLAKSGASPTWRNDDGNVRT